MPDAIQRGHAAYCAEVGGDSWPMSLESARFIAGLHEQHKFQSAADIGSGFTSWLLRHLEIPRVVSFEVDPVWAQRTGTVLAGMGMKLAKSGAVVPWPPAGVPVAELSEGTARWAGAPFGLVVYDTSANISQTQSREAELPFVASMVAPGGLLVIDDFNWPKYAGFVEGYFTALGWCVGAAFPQTVDRYGRFVGLVGPKPASASIL